MLKDIEAIQQRDIELQADIDSLKLEEFPIKEFPIFNFGKPQNNENSENEELQINRNSPNFYIDELILDENLSDFYKHVLSYFFAAS